MVLRHANSWLCFSFTGYAPSFIHIFSASQIPKWVYLPTLLSPADAEEMKEMQSFFSVGTWHRYGEGEYRTNNHNYGECYKEDICVAMEHVVVLTYLCGGWRRASRGVIWNLRAEGWNRINQAKDRGKGYPHSCLCLDVSFLLRFSPIMLFKIATYPPLRNSWSLFCSIFHSTVISHIILYIYIYSLLILFFSFCFWIKILIKFFLYTTMII